MRIIPYPEWASGLEWRSTPPRIPTPQPRVWLHHGAAGTSSISTARGYARFHMRERGYHAVGYSFLIAEGRVLEGRGAGRQGAHTRGENMSSHGVCMVGSYESRLPSARDLNALVWLLEHGAERGWWPEPKLTGGHRDAPGAATSCPGTALWRHIPTINSRDQEDDVMTDEQDARLKRVEQQVAGLGAAVAELSAVASELSRSVGGRSVSNDLRRLRISQRAIGSALNVPVDNGGPDDGTVIVS